jgi:Sulfotransferase family
MSNFLNIACTQKPILLLGMERSGTTWLGKIFDSHPLTLYLHEPDSWDISPIDIPMFISLEESNRYKDIIVSYFDNLLSIRSIRVFSKTPFFHKYYVKPISKYFLEKYILFAKLLTKFHANLPYYYGFNNLRVPNIRLTLKSVESAGRLGVIAKAINDIQCIYIIRHPCGYVASVLRGEQSKKFRGDNPTANDFNSFSKILTKEHATKYNLDMTTVKAMSPVERLAWRWVIFNEKSLDEIKLLENCLYIKYEDLCHNPIDITKQLFGFVGLDWSDQTDEFINKSTSSELSSYYSVYKNPLVSANKWMQELSKADIDVIMSVVEKTSLRNIYTL